MLRLLARLVVLEGLSSAALGGRVLVVAGVSGRGGGAGVGLRGRAVAVPLVSFGGEPVGGGT